MYSSPDHVFTYNLGDFLGNWGESSIDQEKYQIRQIQRGKRQACTKL